MTLHRPYQEFAGSEDIILTQHKIADNLPDVDIGLLLDGNYPTPESHTAIRGIYSGGETAGEKSKEMLIANFILTHIPKAGGIIHMTSDVKSRLTGLINNYIRLHPTARRLSEILKKSDTMLVHVLGEIMYPTVSISATYDKASDGHGWAIDTMQLPAVYGKPGLLHHVRSDILNKELQITTSFSNSDKHLPRKMRQFEFDRINYQKEGIPLLNMHMQLYNEWSKLLYTHKPSNDRNIITSIADKWQESQYEGPLYKQLILDNNMKPKYEGLQFFHSIIVKEIIQYVYKGMIDGYKKPTNKIVYNDDNRVIEMICDPSNRQLTFKYFNGSEEQKDLQAIAYVPLHSVAGKEIADTLPKNFHPQRRKSFPRD